MLDTVTLPLPKPVDVGGQRLEALIVREPTVGELVRAKARGDVDADTALLAEVCGVGEHYEALAGALSARLIRKALDALQPSLLLFAQLRTSAVLPEGVKTDDDLPDTLTLRLPQTIQMGTTWVDSLELREPTGLEMLKFQRELERDELKAVLILVALASGQPRMIVERLPVSIFARAAAYVLGFTIGVPQPGRTS